MMSDKEFLATELENGIGMHNPDFKELARLSVDQINDLGIKTVLDYGAGTGVYADAYHQAGYDIKAFEVFKAHRDYMKEHVPHIHILKNPITTDLLHFIETAEHMTDKELDSLFNIIAPKYVLFSSTSEKTDNDIPWGHINIKEQAEWDLFFELKGYFKVRDLSLPTTWSKLYTIY
jgi:2-polyprenyl-3-methyl-5-hydroxy-6-metoxy-1,4-benzoquinol methylase